MTINDGLFSSNTDLWATPQSFFDKLNKEFGFSLDPCATHENAKCDYYFTKEKNGLLESWEGETVFCNPPYGREINKWVEKAYKEGLKPNTSVVLLIPARTDTKYWHEFIFGKGEIRFVKGRLKFGDASNSAPFPSAVIVFGEKAIINKVVTMGN
jgi:site-specific DNA-methyltransferase (adenine-specific)